MRFVVIGAGAIGGVVGGGLARAGHEVAWVARGAHGRAIREHGLRIESPSGTAVVRAPVVERIGDAAWDGAVALLCVKTPDAAGALRELAVAAPDAAVACFTNGVEAERMALRWFERVYGVNVICPATYLEAGTVLAWGVPYAAILDVGRAPGGVDETAERLAAALAGALGRSRADADILRWKRAKLLLNLTNAIDALCGPAGRASPLARAIKDEGAAVLRAARLPFATEAEDTAARADYQTGEIAGRAHPGGSTWQSLARGATVLECEFLNGEICLLAREHGTAAPLNAALLREVTRAAAARTAPGSLSVEELTARVRS
jgi:2-dehydropantoate 2-reductase